MNIQNGLLEQVRLYKRLHICMSCIIYLLYNSLVTKKHLNLLCQNLEELNADWEWFGIALHVPYATIEEIKTNPDGQKAENKMIEVLKKLKQQGKSWRDVYDAVTDLHDNALAEDIKQRHPNLDSKGKYILYVFKYYYRMSDKRRFESRIS